MASVPSLRAGEPATPETSKTVESKPSKEPPAITASILVTATRTERIVDDVPVSVTIVSAQDLEEAPAIGIDNLLRTIAGFNLPLQSSQNAFPALNRLSMRGLGEFRTLVLLDGVPINDPYRGNVQWNKVPKESLSRIEVIRGASANLFGNYALGGTINLITRPVSGSDIRLDASAGSYGTFRFNLGLDQMITESVGIGVNATRQDSDGYVRTPFEERGSIDIPSWSELTSIAARADSAHPDGGRLFVRTSYFDNEISLGTPLTGTHSEFLDTAVGGTVLPGANHSVVFSAFYQDGSLDSLGSRFASDRNSEIPTSDSDLDTRDLGANAQWSTDVCKTLPFFSVGLDMRRIDADEVSNRLNPNGSVRLADLAGGTQTFTGVFSQLSWRPAESVEVLAGARLDSWTNSDGYRTGDLGEVIRYSDRSSSELSPRIAVRWEVSDRVAIRTAVYQGFKAPTLRDLYRSAAFGRQVLQPNPELEAETLIGGEMGIDVSAGWVRTQLNVFRNEVDDLISDIPVQFEPLLIFERHNIGKTRSDGAELMADLRPAGHWHLTMSYTFTDAKVMSHPADPALEGNRIPDIPRHAAGITARYRFDSGSTIVLRGRSESTRFFDAENELTLDGTTLFDVSASYPIHDRVDIFLIGENLFDREYIVDRGSQNRIGDPQQFFAGIRFRRPLGGRGW